MIGQYDEHSLTDRKYTGGLKADDKHAAHVPSELSFKAKFGRKRFYDERIMSRLPGKKNWAISRQIWDSLDKHHQECPKQVITFSEHDGTLVGWQYWSAVREWPGFGYIYGSWICNGELRSMDEYPSDPAIYQCRSGR